MSHTTAINAIKITDAKHLAKAVEALKAQGIKCSLIANATPRAYFNNQKGMGHADFVLKLDDSPYDIGFYKTADGSFEPRTDFHAGHIQRILGARASDPSKAQQAQMGKLFQEYGIAGAMDAARKKGYDVRRNTAADGTVTLVMTGHGM